MGLLRITVDETGDINAVKAELHLTVTGTSAVMGNAAVKKAAEIRSLADALTAAGIASEAIEVRGMSLTSEKGLLGKNQQVNYRVVVQVEPEELPAALGAVTAQPTIALQRIEWRYAEFEASIPLAASAMRKARRKADAIAEAAGMRVTGVHNASDSWSMPSVTVGFEDGAYGMLRSAAPAPKLDPGVEFQATRELQVSLTVDFTTE